MPVLSVLKLSQLSRVNSEVSRLDKLRSGVGNPKLMPGMFFKLVVQSALSQTGEVINAQSAQNWFAKSTARIELVRAFDKSLSASLITGIEKQLNASQSAMLSIMVIFISVTVAKYMHNRLHSTVSTAQQNYDLSVRVKNETSDERRATSDERRAW